MTAIFTRRRLTVDEYQRMGQAGILHEDERVELIEGDIVEMAPIGPAHMGTVATLTRLFGRLVGDRALVWIQNAIRLGRHIEPQPDVVLLRPRRDNYRTLVPGADDVLLLIEVADSSLAYDRDVKLLLYAAAGIPDVWIVDLQHEVVILCRDPFDGRYQNMTSHGRGSTLSPLAFPDLAIGWADVFGER